MWNSAHSQQDWQKAQRRADETTKQKPASAESTIPLKGLYTPGSLLQDARIKHRGNAPVRHSIIQSAQKQYGNFATRRAVQRFSNPFEDYDPNPTPYIPPNITYGSPPGEGVSGPYGYLKSNRHSGVEMGFGSSHGQSGGNSADTHSVEVKAGAWDETSPYDPSVVDTRSGWKLGGAIGKATTDKGRAVSADAGYLSGNLEASVGTDGATLGVQGNVVEASATIGSLSKSSQTDQTVRAGASEGWGLAGRLHWGDKDGDGVPEVGGGFDLGPVSFDVKTEDPIRTALHAYSISDMPGSSLANMAAGSTTQNLTQGARGAIDDVLRDIGVPLGLTPKNPYELPFEQPSIEGAKRRIEDILGPGNSTPEEPGVGLIGPHDDDSLSRTPGRGGPLGPIPEEPLSGSSGGWGRSDPLGIGPYTPDVPLGRGPGNLGEPPTMSGGGSTDLELPRVFQEGWGPANPTPVIPGINGPGLDLPSTGGGGVAADPGAWDVGDWF